MNNPNQFDDGFFAQRAEGNFPTPPNSFLQSPVIKRAGDSWVTPFITRASIIHKPMRSMSCGPVTLNSFSAFADAANFDPTTDTPDGLVVQPAAVKGNGWLDTISGTVQGLVPVAQTAATNYISGASSGQPVNTTTAAQKQLLKQYLAGKLPQMTLNAQGQVVPKSTAATSSMSTLGPILGLAGVGLVLFMVMGMRKK